MQCAHFIPTKYSDIGYCSLYVRFKGPKAGSYTLHEFADVIRDDKAKCGPTGIMFKHKKLEITSQ